MVYHLYPIHFVNEKMTKNCLESIKKKEEKFSYYNRINMCELMCSNRKIISNALLLFFTINNEISKHKTEFSSFLEDEKIEFE